MVSMPGAFTPTEIVAAHRAGADIVKIFPATVGGVDYIKAVRGPLAHIPLAAVGGVEPGNAADFLKAGAMCLGVGSNLVNAKKVAAGDFESVTRVAREFARACGEGRAV
jgi:2-dehydro-3-deoxyphosphogluconate aldolase/(4S)-4-hydroxy-2-oxoglutarate aldolase